jgi:hypothetical protein
MLTVNSREPASGLNRALAAARTYVFKHRRVRSEQRPRAPIFEDRRRPTLPEVWRLRSAVPP